MSQKNLANNYKLVIRDNNPLQLISHASVVEGFCEIGQGLGSYLTFANTRAVAMGLVPGPRRIVRDRRENFNYLGFFLIIQLLTVLFENHASA